MADEVHGAKSETSKTGSGEDVAALSKQVNELNQKIDTLNTKMEKTQAANEALLEHQKTVVANTNAARAQEVVRQTVASPTGFIAKEIVTYILKYLEKNQKSKTQQWFATRGRGMAESAIAFYISQKLPGLNWYGTSVAGTETEDHYHVNTTTNFPVTINTGVPFLGNFAIARIVLNVECDVNTKTNETSNIKCHLSAADMQKDLWSSIKEDLTNWLQPHKTIWSIVHGIWIGLTKFMALMKRNPNFSIPFLILFIFTAFIAPNTPPAQQIWLSRHWASTNLGFFGIRPMSLLYGIINGIIWGLVIWVIVKFHLIPGLGKAFHFIKTKIFPPIRRWFSHPYRRWGTVGVIIACIVLFILWRKGVFEPPPPLQFAASTIPNGRVGTAYTADFTSIGGKKPYTWQSTNQALPAGLTLDPITGKLSGSPATAGNYDLTILVTDHSKKINYVAQIFKINISMANTLIISDTSLPAGKVGEEYKAKINTVGGAAPFRWGITAGSIPPGIVLGTDGTFSGLPKSAGTFQFTVSVDDSSATKMSYDQTYTVTIKK